MAAGSGQHWALQQVVVQVRAQGVDEGIWQVAPSQEPEQQEEADSAVQLSPFGWQPQYCLPSASVWETPWQHWLQLSVWWCLPRGFLAGQRWPVGMHASLWGCGCGSLL